jgi:hydrogenase expression/formation protein HypE
MPSFRTGKIPSDILVRNVFRYKGKRDASVILGSSIGEDAALVSLGDSILVLKTDPVTGTTSDIGWLAVHINANDIACRGARPRWFLCDVLLPEKSNAVLLDDIMRQVDRAAKEIGVAVAGGHTEVTPGLRRPIVVGCMVGVTRKKQFVTSNGARPGDIIIMTKSVGIEGTSILAADFARRLRFRSNSRLVAKAKSLGRLISVVDDAMIAVSTGGVRAMHDPTEGGLLQGIWELAEASKIGFHIHEANIDVRPETDRICSILGVDPLRLMSSGCLLIAADRRRGDLILQRLKKKGIQGSIIGTFTPRGMGRKLVRLDGTVTEIGPSERDELYRIIETHHG